jgi:hypothetical protein
VANGKKMMPSRGTSHVLKAAATSAGLATQTMNSADRGNNPANIANRQPIVRSLHRIWEASSRSVEARDPGPPASDAPRPERPGEPGGTSAYREMPNVGARKDYECFLANFLNRLEIFALVWGSLALRIIFSSRLFAFGDFAASSTRFISRPITAHLPQPGLATA